MEVDILVLRISFNVKVHLCVETCSPSCETSILLFDDCTIRPRN